MIVLSSDGRMLAGLVICDACQGRIQGEGKAYTLQPSDERRRIGEVFTVHTDCVTLFEYSHPAPLGMQWSRISLKGFLNQLIHNSQAPSHAAVDVARKRGEQ